jgi:cephalosporin-C deacetylase-like acetyl esterase
VYRQAFEVGRHIIGYEVQKVLAAVDALENFNKDLQQNLPIGVAGVGDGGLLAMHAAALDPRIDATWVAGYFQPREGVWDEPIDRNVWRLLGATAAGD